ncbi:MAG: hypothetical protein AB1480_10300 [Nitrospirota bacterium]
MVNKLKLVFTILFLSLLLCEPVDATILFQSTAESGTCNTVVPQAVWDPRAMGSDMYPNNIMYYRCDTPVPNSGRSKYFRVDTVDNQTDSGNAVSVSQINLTPGVTYYLGLFVRFDRINQRDIWHDGDGQPDSSDKLFEFQGNTRLLIDAGFPDWATCSGGACDHHFTFGAYLSPRNCTGCIYEQIWPNVPPYDRDTMVLVDYEKWNAVVLGYTPSTGGSATNGRIQLWINGIKTHDWTNIKTQDSATPYIWMFGHSGTTAQPAYDAPAHYRKFDGFIFSNSLTDIQNAGLMSDPSDAVAPSYPIALSIQ